VAKQISKSRKQEGRERAASRLQEAARWKKDVDKVEAGPAFLSCSSFLVYQFSEDYRYYEYVL
jgi:hypothetical protein